MTSGVYAIRNNINGFLYIGQSIVIEKRWMQHKSNLRGNIHESALLQKAWNKYGEENFSFILLEKLPQRFLSAAEEWWINHFDSTHKGYNVSQGGKGTKGVIPWNVGLRHSKETRYKIAEKAKLRTREKNGFYGKKHTDETRNKLRAARCIPVIDLDTNIVYLSAKDADKAFNGKGSNVSKAVNHGTKAYKHHWAYYKDDSSINQKGGK